MMALLRGPGSIELHADIGGPGGLPATGPDADGLLFIRVIEGGTWIPYRDAGERTPGGLPVYEYAM